MLKRIVAFFGHTVFKRLCVAVVLLAIYSALDVFVETSLNDDIHFPDGVQAVLGGVLSLLLVFRTNSAYDRWWEARKLWGSLVNDTRNLALKVRTLVHVPQAERKRAGEVIMAFPNALRDHLRGRRSPYGPEGVHHVPLYLARAMFEHVNRWKESGAIDGFTQTVLDRHVSAYMDIAGACERIRNTPLPLSHRALIPQVLLCYLLVLPISLPDNLWTIVVTCTVGYFMLGLEFIAEELEEPFGHDSDDLPLEAFCANMERSVLEVLNEDITIPSDSSMSAEQPAVASPV